MPKSRRPFFKRFACWNSRGPVNPCPRMTTQSPARDLRRGLASTNRPLVSHERKARPAHAQLDLRPPYPGRGLRGADLHVACDHVLGKVELEVLTIIGIAVKG